MEGWKEEFVRKGGWMKRFGRGGGEREGEKK